jgi:hypothetical protein
MTMGMVISLADAFRPVQLVQVHQHGTAGVGDVSHVRPTACSAGEVPDDPGVNVAEDGIAALGRFAYTCNVVENPLHFGTGEVGGQGEADLFAEPVLADVAFKLFTDFVGAGVLPDDGVVEWFAGIFVPNDGGFALIGDTNSNDVGGGEVAFLHRAFDDVLGARPNFHGIMFHPAWFGIDLFVFQLVAADRLASVVEDHAAGTGCTLVNRGYVILGHFSLLTDEK